MPQNYSGRITLILVILGAALVAVFWPSLANPKGVGFNPNVPLSQKLNLKPGIDIVGGTSLLYEIKVPEGAANSQTLAEDVTKALKRRVDPQGVLNLIWRPQNPNRLEIQMPLSGVTGEAANRQKALDDAREQLEATNIRLGEAIAWVEQTGAATPAATGPATAPSTAPTTAPARSAARLDELTKGSPKRKKILQDMAAAYDAIKAADAEPNAALRATAGQKARANYKRLQDELASTNLGVAELTRVLTLKAEQQRNARLEAIKASNADFPQRVAAIDAYVSAQKAVSAGGGGLESAADLKRMLRGSGLLEFHILPEPNDPALRDAGHPLGYQSWVEQLRKIGPRGTPGDSYRWFEVDDAEQFGERQTVNHDDRHWVLASVKPTESLDAQSGDWKLAGARAETDPQSGARIVAFEFDRLGAQLFGALTTANQKRPMAIMLDGRVISAPNINEPITGGNGRITGGSPGGFSQKELSYLVSMLSAGSLPAQLDDEPIYERTVGSSVGEDNLRSGLMACALGLVVVAIFLIGYYYLAGLVAYICVILNLIIILGAMAAINATFTLPGIAAVILTVGSAVDANVLIFERLREEQHRGLAIRMAVRNAYDRAFSAILDSNMTTIITSFFLIIFGTEEVKGFGITLIIGIFASLFTSLFVTKTIFGLLIDRFGIKKLGSLPLSIPKWDQMLRPNIRWTKLVLPFAAFSVIFIVIGCGLFGMYASRNQVMDIEFAGGTAVTFEINTPQKQSVVRDWIAAEEKRNPQGLPAPQVVRVGTDNLTWEVTTASTNAVKVREAVLSAVGTNLKAELPSTFTGLNQSVNQILDGNNGIVFPLTKEILSGDENTIKQWPGGLIPDEARRYSGGAAVVLRNLTPPMSAKDIETRLNRQKLQAHAASVGAAASPVTADFSVIGIEEQGKASVSDPNKPVSTALILTGESDIDYARAGDELKWQQGLVAPLWELVQEAIARPPQLQQVRNVDASVAGDTQKDAMVALIASIAFIMAYIWVRFGNLKYGTATVVALLHDVFFCIAALGFAHLLSGNAFGEALQLQPFRINLTVIAAILTIMGYSMLDTIVVFDRIREIRGKYGHVSANVINDAINQTLSRTLLTAGTTIISVAIMYFIGGEGIHGFTFVLFVGILAGTYSSIAIASPLLLIGGKSEEVTTPAGRSATAAT